MYKWAKAISGKQILTEDSWKLAFTSKVNRYGYGWMTGEFFKHSYIRHSGGYPGYMSEFIYYPEEDLTIILLNNFGTYDQMIWAVGMGIASIAHNMPYDSWRIRKPIKLSKEILARYAGVYELKGDKRKFTIELRDDSIFIIIPGLPPIELFSESENVFFFQNFNTEYKFVTDEKNEVLKVIVREHGENYDLVRVQ